MGSCYEHFTTTALTFSFDRAAHRSFKRSRTLTWLSTHRVVVEPFGTFGTSWRELYCCSRGALSCYKTTFLPCGPCAERYCTIPIQRDLLRDSHVFGPLLKALKCCGSAVFPAAANTLLMGWACGAYGWGEGMCRVLVGKPEGKKPLGRPRRRWVDNIRMDLQEVGCGYIYWIWLAQDRDTWRTLVSAVMNLRVPWNAGNFLTSCKPVSFSRRTLHHEISK